MKHESVNTKITQQGYGIRLYFKLVLNILKIMGFTYVNPLGDLIQGNFHGDFHVPID
jgi:lipopolysaccharide export system protein LptA